MKVFLFGSRSISFIPNNIFYFLKIFVREGDSFLVGDCSGVDTLFQILLKRAGAIDVLVYHIGQPRNNVGNFKTRLISGNKYTDKDDVMIKDCDKAIAVHRNTPGSLRNIRELKKLDKGIWEFGPEEIDKLQKYYVRLK